MKEVRCQPRVAIKHFLHLKIRLWQQLLHHLHDFVVQKELHIFHTYPFLHLKWLPYRKSKWTRYIIKWSNPVSWSFITNRPVIPKLSAFLGCVWYMGPQDKAEQKLVSHVWHDIRLGLDWIEINGTKTRVVGQDL